MRTTIDIPDGTYKSVKMLAVEHDSTVKDLVLEGLNLLLSQRRTGPPSERLKLPLIRSTRTDKVDLSNEEIYDLIDFP